MQEQSRSARGEFKMSVKAKTLLGWTALRRIGVGAALVLTASLAATAPARCDFFGDNVIHRGYIFDDQALAQVRVGSPAEQVLIVLGTPSTTSTIGGDAWYYISQKVERLAPFLPARVTEQRVFAVYFDKNKKVTRTGNYALEDGKVIDFSTRETVTAGGENRLLQTLIKQVGNFQFRF
jgi:outer membrane protein assembly factor BamE (lipoprotein component of BamABCDE complex)